MNTPCREVEKIFHEALRRDPAQRDAYMREACHGDTELHREVSSLLANHREAGAESWAAAAAAQLVDSSTSLQPGQLLGPYRIESFIAAGGMGEVYRATDTRLQRQVAIKVSSARFSERFEREARVIASLNHPNICQLHDVGPNYLVMELVEGPTLADRIKQGALALDEALAIARQITEALEAAHEKGIVHRDLKPANVKIKPDGTVKVLDFGLAKACDGAPVTDTSNSPTQTISATRAGVILGTPAYMSPEQARAGTVDKRADIWAFGCVVYEMLTGKPVFRGMTTSDILAAVLKEEPDWSRISAKVQPLLRRCLMKDPKHRLRDIGDAMPLLEGAPEAARARAPWLWVAGVLVIALALVAAMGWWRATRTAPLLPLMKLNAELPPGITVDRFTTCCSPAISPDGTRIAIVEQVAGGRLATRRLDQDNFLPLAGTEGASRPFFSPDGRWIAFFADRMLKKVAVQGGSPVTLCDAPSPRGGSWGDDDNIIIAYDTGSIGLARVPSEGGTPVPVTKLSKENAERAHAWPQVLPGGRAVLFTASRGGFDNATIDILIFKTGERKTVLRNGTYGRYLPSGHLIYMHQNTLYAAPFSLTRLAVTGAAQPALDNVVSFSSFGSANFDFSQSGIFVYLSGKTGEGRSSIFWLDSAGNLTPFDIQAGSYTFLTLSPDGRRLAFVMGHEPGRFGIWVHDIERKTTSPLTSLPGLNDAPVWTPDGRHIVFLSRNQPNPGTYWMRADGSGDPQRLMDGEFPQPAGSFSPNGKRLAYTQLRGSGQTDIWTVPVEGDSDHPRLGKADLFLRASGYQKPAFSPDGRWLAYQASEGGSPEVYVRAFSGPADRWQISTGGGRYPMWSRSASGVTGELFYLAPDDRIMAVTYTTTGDGFTPGKPRIWSEKKVAHVTVGNTYALAPDGKRCAVVLDASGSTEEQRATDSVTVLLNFFDELRRRVPAGEK